MNPTDDNDEWLHPVTAEILASASPAELDRRAEALKVRLEGIDAQLKAPGLQAAGRGMTRSEAAEWVLRAQHARECVLTDLVAVRGEKAVREGQLARLRNDLVLANRTVAVLRRRVAELSLANATLERRAAVLGANIRAEAAEADAAVLRFVRGEGGDAPAAEDSDPVTAEERELRRLAAFTPKSADECTTFLRALPAPTTFSASGRRALGAIQAHIGALRKTLRGG